MSKQFWLSSMVVLMMVFAGTAQGQQKAENSKPAEAGAVQIEVRVVGEKGAPGQPAGAATIIVNGRPIRVNEGTLVLQSSALSATAGQYWLGLEVEPVSEALIKKLDLPAHQGLVVKEVLPGSPAVKAGIKPHDVLLKAGKKPMGTIQDLIDVVQAAKETDVILELDRKGKVEKISIRPAKRAGNVIELHAGVPDGSGTAMPGGPMPGGPMPGMAMPGGPMPGAMMYGNPMPGMAMPGGPMPGMPGAQMPGAMMYGNRMPGMAMPSMPMPGASAAGSMAPEEIRKMQIRTAIMLLQQAGLQQEAEPIRKKLEAIERERPRPLAVDNGAMSAEQAALRIERTAELLKRLDVNGDGMIDADEGNNAMMQRLFQRMGIEPRYPISIGEIKARMENFYRERAASSVAKRPDPTVAELRDQIEQMRREMKKLAEKVEMMSKK